jgi:hypothetical protein
MTTATIASFTSGQRVLVNGKEAEYVGPASCGCCEHRVQYVGNDYPDFTQAGDTIVAADKPSEPRPFQVGDRVRITRTIGGVHGESGTVGTVVEGNGQTESTRLAFRPDAASGTEGGYGDGRYYLIGTPDTLFELIEPAAEPTVASGDLADALARAEKAERDLENFRVLVRDRLIEEAVARDWCSEADEWLESLGLEPRANPQRASVSVNITLSVSVEGDYPSDICEHIGYDEVREALIEEHGSQMRYVDFTYDVDECERL